MAKRVAVVMRNAGALRTSSWATFCQRSQTSCTTSSASAALWSVRYATANMRERALMKLDMPSAVVPASGGRCTVSMRLHGIYGRQHGRTITHFHESRVTTTELDGAPHRSPRAAPDHRM